MKKIKIAYLLLGIGIGIILTSGLHSVYPEIRYNELSDEMVIERAENLGYVSLTEKISREKIKDDTEEIEVEAEDEKEPEKTVGVKDKDLEKAEENINKEEKEEKEIEKLINIKIEKGDKLSEIAEKLYDASLIKSEEEFKFLVKTKGLEKNLIYGNYNFKIGMTYDEIIDLLIK